LSESSVFLRKQPCGCTVEISGEFTMVGICFRHATGLDVCLRLGQAGIDDPALERGIFPVYNRLGSENNPALVRPRFDYVAASQAQLGTEASWNGHLTFALYFDERGHRNSFAEVGKANFDRPRISVLLKAVKSQRVDISSLPGLTSYLLLVA
jgi:hypothetical protein